jgi:hypothetical protein
MEVHVGTESGLEFLGEERVGMIYARSWRNAAIDLEF